MTNFLKRTWVEINLDNIKYNYEKIKSRINDNVKIMCVIKADAYGHGAEFLAKEYSRLGADWFAVSNIDEAIQLRTAGIAEPILILGYTPVEMTDYLLNFNITQAVFSEEYAIQLSSMAQKFGTKLNIHIKLDTGMSRIGLLCHNEKTCIDAINICERIHNMNGLNVQGIFTHFAISDNGNEGIDFTNAQFEKFKFVVDGVKKKNIEIPLCHCCNSGGIVDYPHMHMDIVRAGIILYGLMPSSNTNNKLNLKPAMQLKTVISQIKNIEKNTRVSYGGTYIAKDNIRIATIPIGYADGYSRSFSNKSSMLVCGKRANVIGRVCMDQLMLDVTNISEAKEGDVVTVFGEDLNNKITVEELAALSNTIGYEIICLIGKRVPRIYYKDGQIVGRLNYICR